MSEYNWTSEQMTMIVRSIDSKLSKDLDFLVFTKKDNNCFTIESRYQDRGAEQFYFSLHKPYTVRAHLSRTNGDYKLSYFPWQDVEIKNFIGKVRKILLNMEQIRATQSIHKVFPDVVAREFEKDILE